MTQRCCHATCLHSVTGVWRIRAGYPCATVRNHHCCLNCLSTASDGGSRCMSGRQRCLVIGWIVLPCIRRGLGMCLGSLAANRSSMLWQKPCRCCPKMFVLPDVVVCKWFCKTLSLSVHSNEKGHKKTYMLSIRVCASSCDRIEVNRPPQLMQ